MAKRKRRGSKGPYRYTSKRAAALKRAQTISARKRKGQRNAAIKGVVAGATLAGIGAGAIYGYKNRSTIKATTGNWKNAVQPGSKERVRVANAISGAIIRKPTSAPDRPFSKAALDAKQQAANIRAAKKANKASGFNRSDLGTANPNAVDPGRNNAFPKQQRDVEIVNKLITGSDRPYNIDKFIPRGVKGLIFGKRVTGNAASRAVAAHVEAKGKMNVGDVDASGILHNMIADGTVTRVYGGRKVKPKSKPPIKPRNSRAGVTRKPKPKSSLESKAFDQWLKDFGD